jgi:bifunctional enzyme CysN/CysC
METRQHSFILSVIGGGPRVLAVNKIDLFTNSEEIFNEIESAYRAFASPLGFNSLWVIPVSARRGDNVSRSSVATPWYTGSLLSYLESLQVSGDQKPEALRFPVQRVDRTNPNLLGFLVP